MLYLNLGISACFRLGSKCPSHVGNSFCRYKTRNVFLEISLSKSKKSYDPMVVLRLIVSRIYIEMAGLGSAKVAGILLLPDSGTF